jgi:hypothetical protein
MWLSGTIHLASWISTSAMALAVFSYPLVCYSVDLGLHRMIPALIGSYCKAENPAEPFFRKT